MIRSKGALYTYTLLALFFTVPWFFMPSGEKEVPLILLGFPTWALYAVVASALYACFMAYCLGRHWDLSAGSDEDQEED